MKNGTAGNGRGGRHEVDCQVSVLVSAGIIGVVGSDTPVCDLTLVCHRPGDATLLILHGESTGMSPLLDIVSVTVDEIP